MAARRPDAEAPRSVDVAPFAAPGGHDSAPPGIDFHELREAIRVVIGSVDKLRDEALPDICGKLRSIESSTHAAHGAASRAPSHADAAGPPSRSSSSQLPYNAMGGPSAASSGESHANGQTNELRDVVRGLHEHLEERMQAMYQQHSARWEERLQELLGEARREHPLVAPSLLTQPSTSEVGLGSHARSRHPSPCVGQWRDLQGGFWYGTAIAIAEEGWHPLEPGMSELEPAAAYPIEFLSSSRCRLLLPADETNSQGAPFDAELSLDDSLIVTHVDDTSGGASFALTRVGDRRRSKRASKRTLTTPDGQTGLTLLTPGRPPSSGHALAGRLASSVRRGLSFQSAASVDLEGLSLECSRGLQLPNRKRGRLGGVFLTKRYELVQVVMILLDAIVLAWRTQHAAESLARRPSESARDGIRDDALLVLLSDLFCVWFALDLAGRALAEGRRFFRSAVLLSHSFEVFVVVAYILEAVAVHTNRDEGSKSLFRVWVGLMSFARTLRLLRLVHMSKIVRHNSAFRELRMMMYALKGAMKSLVWSFVMLLVILLISGTVFTNGYLRHIVYNQQVPDGKEGKELLALRDAFGTLFVSMFTLMKTVTGGTDWGEVYPLLEPMDWPYQVFYVLFQIFATLALLNVITAVFVESTMQRSAQDRESAVIDEIAARRKLLTRLNALFEELGGDGDGQIRREDLKKHMQKRHIAAYFSSLGVDVDQVGKLFLLLDQDNSGTIDRQEFLRGCSRLKGDAKSVDLAVLQSDVDLLIQDMEELSELMYRSVEKIDLLFESRVAAVQSGIYAPAAELHI